VYPSSPETRQIKCLLVDDHELIRAGIRRLLEAESDFVVVGEANNAGGAVEQARELEPDIVLMDIGMPGLSSFEAARLIQESHPQTRVLFLTMYEDEEYMLQSIEAGGAGYMLKDSPANALLGALREVQRGGRYVSRELLHRLRGSPATGPYEGMTRSAKAATGPGLGDWRFTHTVAIPSDLAGTTS